MYKRLEKCPLCKSGHFHNEMIVQDHMVSQEKFAVCKCDNCEIMFTNPRPERDNLAKYYESDAYISHTGKSYGLISPIYRLVRKYALRKKVKLVNRHAPKKARLLDIGCGTGHFLKSIAHDGWQASGVEVNDQARNIAVNQTPGIVYPSIDKIPPKSKFEVITMWHVLEHVDNLEKTIQQLKELLVTKGILILALPNSYSYDAQYYKEDWAGYDVPRHLYHFNRDAIKHLSSEYKLKWKETYPMIFDSFYVSMLSEKYRTGKPNYFKAFKTGLASNRNARKTKEYSSLIYVLKK
ncbi:class I SAM-dependent methyltransferase [Roseivirga sp. BDSF3-8]|uniref:class I SAM-dependent methyltransferase n=1 Tax=Roseivirga sp. BDSF3-8 TaxID=3241598 RepID=UPI003531C79E